MILLNILVLEFVGFDFLPSIENICSTLSDPFDTITQLSEIFQCLIADPAPSIPNLLTAVDVIVLSLLVSVRLDHNQINEFLVLLRYVKHGCNLSKLFLCVLSFHIIDY
jgi:hypothetical protein